MNTQNQYLNTEKFLKDAKAILSRHLQAEHLWVTSDGTFFLPDKKSYAEDHKSKNKLEIAKLTRHEVDQALLEEVNQEDLAKKVEDKKAIVKPKSKKK